MQQLGIHYMRPHGRHILTIGKDLIQDVHAAVIELVKNAYDADSDDIHISFKKITNFKQKINSGDAEKEVITEGIQIVISDSGHGMNSEVIVQKWLVPSTNDKADRKLSPKGRVMQGRKGIGRYSVSILGQTVKLETVDADSIQSILEINWEDFNNAQFLDQVPIEITSSKVSMPNGTTLTIVGGQEYLEEWTEREFTKLISQLKRLKSPVDSNNFKILISVDEHFSFGCYESNFEVTPHEIIDRYDYRINGKVTRDGILEMEYHNQRSKGTDKELIIQKLEFPVICGAINFDIRVFDREPAAIDELIKRGLKSPTGEPLAKLEARKLLDTVNGLAVYRNNFRVRPLGDPGYDWLRLDARRIQMPALRIGSNQIVGHVEIESEEFSHLEEKSARDGLRENKHYNNLIEIMITTIRELEPRRFKYRKDVGLGRDSGKVEEKLENLFQFDNFKEKMEKELTKAGIEGDTVATLVKLVDEEQREKNKIVEDIRKAIALYQGQATLGKIINVVLHEGRRPLGFFRNQVSNVKFWGEDLLKNYTKESHDKLVLKMDSFDKNSASLVNLFSKIDPLASGRKSKRKDFKLEKVIIKSFEIFENDLTEKGISVSIDCDKSISIFGWEDDFIVILTNLIDNSIFWLNKMGDKNPNKLIQIMVLSQSNGVEINFLDNGPGISVEHIESKMIFEPEFSLKEEGGSGLGLAIAGEACDRNGFQIGAFVSDDGAHFLISSNLKD